MPEAGNSEQSMRVAESIAAAVLDKVLERHPDLKNDKTTSEKLLQWLPLVMVLGGGFYQVAIANKQIEQNAADIAKLEARYDQTQVIMQSVDSRLARIETTLDIVTGSGTKQERPRYARPE